MGNSGRKTQKHICQISGVKIVSEKVNITFVFNVNKCVFYNTAIAPEPIGFLSCVTNVMNGRMVCDEALNACK